MTERQQRERTSPRSAADWTLALDRGDRDLSANAFRDWVEADAEHAEAIARCDALLALAPKLADAPGVAWAFDEASRLARTPRRSIERAGRPAWYRRPGPAWATAAVASAAAAAFGFVALAPAPTRPPAPSSLPSESGASIVPTEDRPGSRGTASAAPFVITADAEQFERLVSIEPVALLANEVAVDGRSIAVLPFSVTETSDGAGAAAAEALHAALVAQLNAIPGLYVTAIEPSTAASYAAFSPQRIALYLGTRAVVQARVDTAGGDVKVEMRFTDAALNGRTIDAVYERPTEDIAMIQNDLFTGLLDALAEPSTPTL